MKVYNVAGHAPSYLPDGYEWELVWNDEFDGPELDETKWDYRLYMMHKRHIGWQKEGIRFDGKEDGHSSDVISKREQFILLTTEINGYRTEAFSATDEARLAAGDEFIVDHVRVFDIVPTPYEQIPFQYSLHVEQEDGSLKHFEFLAKEGEDPRRALAEQLIKDIPEGACSTAYNMSFEKSVLRRLAAQFPDLAKQLMDIHDNMHDLMIPFQKQYYYSAAMQGSYSIKYVLPALWPDDPKLDYHSLEGVHNGAEASAVYAGLTNDTPQEIAVKREQLLRYCELDTYAMVKVLEKLKETVYK